MKKIFLILTSLVLSGVVAISCSKEKKQDTSFSDRNDSNCVIGYEDLAKENGYIGNFSKLSSAANLINVKIGKNCIAIKFDDATKWTWDEAVKDKDTLKAKKGCLFVNVKNEGGKEIATEIRVLPAFKIPKEQLIESAELKNLMNGIPPKSKTITIVDSRPKPVYAEASIPGAINITVPEMKDKTGLAKLPADKNALIVFYCGGLHCKLSPLSAKLAMEAGYKNVRVYQKGYPDWAKNGNPGVTEVSHINSMQKNELSMVLVDIRKNAADSHIPGAAAFTLANLNSYKSQLPKGEDMKRAPIIIYGGNSSSDIEAFALAAKIAGSGYSKVSVLAGGFDAYSKTGKTESNKLTTKINYVHKNPPGFLDGKEFYQIATGKIPSDITFIDVREKEEVKDDASITRLGGINIPLGELKDKVKTLDKNRIYYTFCATGSRAETGRGILDAAGLKSYYVSAGISGPEGSDLVIDDKYSITQEQIAKTLRSKLIEN